MSKATDSYRESQQMYFSRLGAVKPEALSFLEFYILGPEGTLSITIPLHAQSDTLIPKSLAITEEMVQESAS